MPRGVLWAVGGSAVLGMIALIGFTVAIPDLKTVESAPLPLLAIAGYWLPSWLVKVFVAFVVFSMFAILVVGSGAQARLVYSLSRDNMLPFSGALRKINARSQTPIVALLVFAVIDVGVMIYGYFQTSAFGTLVGATAIIPYIIYFLITLAYAIKRRTTGQHPRRERGQLARRGGDVSRSLVIRCRRGSAVVDGEDAVARRERGRGGAADPRPPADRQVPAAADPGAVR